MWMHLRGKQIPAWVLLLVILGAAAAAVAVGSSGATVLTGDTQVAVADKLVIENVTVASTSDDPAKSTAVIHVANDRVSYMVNFLADEGDAIVITMNIGNKAGIATVVKIVTDAPEEFDVGYSLSDVKSHVSGPGSGSADQLGTALRNIGSEWVLYIGANTNATVTQQIWIKTKPPTPPGQYTVMTWIEQKFQG
jgi:hypothetical protein